ncbi:MAG: hypothetical protein VB106_11605 [Clostridiaceae bacterium]|nr:hypothetical protein [Clostridiaceae bacterium]
MKKLKEWIFKTFFNEYYQLMERSKKFIDRASYKIDSLNRKCKYHEKIYETVNKLINEENTILGIEKNKEDNYMIVCNPRNVNDLYLADSSDRRIKPRIFGRKEGNVIHIDDFFAINEDLGNGSILLKYFINRARLNKAEKIKGWISPVDKERFNKLEYFYKKNGFNVKFKEDRSEGWIELKL